MRLDALATLLVKAIVTDLGGKESSVDADIESESPIMPDLMRGYQQLYWLGKLRIILEISIKSGKPTERLPAFLCA